GLIGALVDEHERVEAEVREHAYGRREIADDLGFADHDEIAWGRGGAEYLGIKAAFLRTRGALGEEQRGQDDKEGPNSYEASGWLQSPPRLPLLLPHALRLYHGSA